MKCRYAHYYMTDVFDIGSSKLPTESFIGCKLKETDEVIRAEIHQTLFKKGYGGSEFDNLCPVAEVEKWDECPYYEKIKSE
ncbi:MAG: hypothetical protein IH964_13055 [Candidatus Dadabacteria bacterium]|nr:hypothetical protein [Candidatus Dadabacteria bacterium]